MKHPSMHDRSAPPTFPWLHTLKFKIVAMAVIVALGATVLTAKLVLATTGAKMQAVLLDGERDDAESNAAMLSTKVDLLRDAMKASARVIPIDLWQKPDALTRHLLERTALRTLFENVIAIDVDGDVIAQTGPRGPPATRVNVADREYFKLALQSDQLVISEPITGRRINAPVVVFAMASMGEDGKPLGLLAGVVALKSNGLFTDRVSGETPGHARTVVMNRAGVVLAHPDPQRLLGRAQDEAGLADAVAHWRDSGSPIDTLGTAKFYQGQLVAMSGIADTNWLLARITDESTALAPIADAQATSNLVAAGVAVGVAGVAGLFAWFLTLPISRLRVRVDRLLKNEEADVSGWRDVHGEVGEVADAFKRVVKQRHLRQTQTDALLKQLEAVLDLAEAGIALTRNGCFELVSKDFCTVFGYLKDEIVGQPTTVIHPSSEAYQAFVERSRHALDHAGSFEAELQLARKGGDAFWARIKGRAVVPGDRTRGAIWTFEDITSSREIQEKLLYTATHDALTGLRNRLAFDADLGKAMLHKERFPFCAMFIDLDRFKQVNDSGGHAAGDAVLKAVSRELSAQVRQADVVARFGGDEFAILLFGCPPQQALEVGEKIRRAVERCVVSWGGNDYTVGASIGLVVVDENYQTATDVLSAADAACYAAKKRGRNALVLHGG